MNVADAMTPRSELVVVDLPGTREDVLTYLQERTFSSVPVVKEEDGNERYRGLVSREDLIEQPDEDQLALLMQDVPTTTANTSLTDVARVFVAENARRIPVVTEDDELEGIITITDVVRAIADGEADGGDAVGDLARRDVNTSYVGTPLPVAEQEISLADVPYTIVLDDDAAMTGILTEADIIDVARVVEGEDDIGNSIANEDDDWMWEGIKGVGNRYFPTRNVELPAGPVSEFMTDGLVTVTGRKTSQEAAQAMLTHDVEQIPLVNGDELTGIVRDVDLVAAL